MHKLVEGRGSMGVDMPRYYFHVRQGDVLFRDPAGVELAGIEEAQSHAARDMEILIGMDALDGPLEAFSMEVWDANGHVLSSPFQPAKKIGVV
jgi:hypothetical protein